MSVPATLSVTSSRDQERGGGETGVGIVRFPVHKIYFILLSQEIEEIHWIYILFHAQDKVFFILPALKRSVHLNEYWMPLR